MDRHRFTPLRALGPAIFAALLYVVVPPEHLPDDYTPPPPNTFWAAQAIGIDAAAEADQLCPTDPKCWVEYITATYAGPGDWPSWLDENGHPR